MKIKDDYKKYLENQLTKLDDIYENKSIDEATYRRLKNEYNFELTGDEKYLPQGTKLEKLTQQPKE